MLRQKLPLTLCIAAEISSQFSDTGPGPCHQKQLKKPGKYLSLLNKFKTCYQCRSVQPSAGLTHVCLADSLGGKVHPK